MQKLAIGLVRFLGGTRHALLHSGELGKCFYAVYTASEPSAPSPG